jgi:glycosyltransferase involved in cell wall biosynthesis
VLHVDTERGWRGGERQVYWLAAELARRGHTSIVAARAGEPLFNRARAGGLVVANCAPITELDPRAAWRLRRVIDQCAIDVVHAHTAHAVAVAALATLGRRRTALVVSRRVDFRLRDNLGTRWKYGRAARIIAISNAVARVLEESGIPGDRVSVVPDGVDVHRQIAPADHTVLASLGVSRGGPLVVQVAQLVGHKDPLNFVRAMARVRERIPAAQAVMVGDGPLRTEVEREIAALAIGDAVHLAGYRDDADALLAAADVACLSSREEGMGSVLLDALAFGVPVAATRAGGIPEVIADGHSGLLAERENPQALADAITRVLADPALAARLSANGRERASEFSVERMTDRTIEVYARALDQALGPSAPRAATATSSSSASVTGAP